MLTFDKVLDVFRPFLAEGVYEVVSTSHGYTILEWDACCQEWISVKLCATPDDMEIGRASCRERVFRAV